MNQQQVHENREMSRALYEDLAALKIRIAFAEISEDEFDEYDRELSSISESDYSEAAQKRALKLIERKLNKQLRRRFMAKTLPQTLHIVLISLLLFFISLTTAVATVRPVRLKLLDFIAQIDENYSAVGLVGNENDALVVPADWAGKFYPFYIPEGFSYERVDPMFCSVRYSTEDHRTLEFCEYENEIYTNIDIDLTGFSDISINGHDGLVHVDEEGTTITWGVEDACFYLYFGGDLEEAKRIAWNVKKILSL